MINNQMKDSCSIYNKINIGLIIAVFMIKICKNYLDNKNFRII
jgi:hypothetical protein